MQHNIIYRLKDDDDAVEYIFMPLLQKKKHNRWIESLLHKELIEISLKWKRYTLTHIYLMVGVDWL